MSRVRTVVTHRWAGEFWSMAEVVSEVGIDTRGIDLIDLPLYYQGSNVRVDQEMIPHPCRPGEIAMKVADVSFGGADGYLHWVRFPCEALSGKESIRASDGNNYYGAIYMHPELGATVYLQAEHEQRVSFHEGVARFEQSHLFLGHPGSSHQ